MVDESRIADRKEFPGDLLYVNRTTDLFEFVERVEYARVTGLTLEIPGFLFAYADPDDPTAIYIAVTDLAYDDPLNPGRSLVVVAGAPASQTDDPGILEIREA